MEISPQRVRNAEFKTIRKGADPDEVKAFLDEVADELERAQNQSTAMEARARAAVARLQELTEGGAAAGGAEGAGLQASAEESETISRTLLLAQRTADGAVADAKVRAEQILAQANEEAARTLDSTREMSASMLAEARAEARQASEAERAAVASEVDALKARRDFLESDVQHLETFLIDQRTRLRDAATSITDIAERVPGGLGEVRAPLLSAADDTGELPRPQIDPSSSPETLETPGALESPEMPEVPEAPEIVDATPATGAGDDWGDETAALVVDDDAWGDDTGAGNGAGDGAGDDADSEFSFSFDDERS
jgi:cell division initiation protein